MRSIVQLMDLSGRRAFVAGGAGHIGGVVCETLFELGAAVAVADREEAACRDRAGTLDLSGRRTLAVACDLSDETATRRAVRQAVQRLGGLEILVHTAAYTGAADRAGWTEPLAHQTVEAWDDALRVNLTSAFVLAQEAHEALIASGRGSVVFVASIYGLVGPDPSLYEGTAMINPTGYGASKGGLLQLTRYLATQFAPAVRVNAVSPGGIWRSQPASFVEKYTARTPLRRMAREEDLKGAVAFLAGDLSAYVTGHNLVVDGGWTAW